MSLPFSAGDAARWTGGARVRGRPETRLEGVRIDTRRVAPGCLFVAIVGPRHDAHAFLADAAAAGAGGLLVARDRTLPGECKPDLPVIEVDDTTRALGALAAGHRAGFSGPLVAITGSNGKTTTKEMCAAILSRRAPCLRNEGNLNNHFGLPLSLLRRGAEHATVVVELGMNHRGEIARLAAIARPTVAVVTNVGTAHIEHLGSRDEIAREKGDILAALPADGTAVLNADDPRVAELAGRAPGRVLRFGLGSGAHADADVRGRVTTRGETGQRFRLEAPEGRVEVELAALGAANVSNALAAAAAALAAGADLGDVAAGLAAYRPVPGRLAPCALAGGALLLDDSYNANPQSLAVALDALAELGAGHRTFAVLGDMGELGETAEAAHRGAGERAAALGIDRVLALGAHAGQMARAAGPERGRVCDDPEAAARAVLAELGPGDVVLVKGSRSMRMERVVERLRAERGR